MKQTGLPEEPAVGLRLHLLTLPARDAKISLHSTGSLPHTKATTQLVTETAAETDMTAPIDAMIVTDVLTMTDPMITTGLSGMAGVMKDLMMAADGMTMIGSADAAEALPPAAVLLHQAETGIGSTAGMVPSMTAGLGIAVSSAMIDPIRTEAIRTVTWRQITGVVRATGARADSMTGMLVTEAEGLREHPAEKGMTDNVCIRRMQLNNAYCAELAYSQNSSARTTKVQADHLLTNYLANCTELTSP